MNDRQFLLNQLVEERGRHCEKCTALYQIYDLHEGIVSRGDVQGWPKELRHKIFNKFNCFILCRDCHREHKLSREDAWKFSCDRYGEEKVREWYEGLPWKLGKPPRNFWGIRKDLWGR